MSDLVERLDDDVRQLAKMVAQARLAGPETGIRVKDPSLLLADLSEAASRISQQDAELERLQREVEEYKSRYEKWRPISETPNQMLILSNVLFDFYCEEPNADDEESAFSITRTWDERPEQAVMWCNIVSPRWPTEEDFRAARQDQGGEE